MALESENKAAARSSPPLGYRLVGGCEMAAHHLGLD
jgi:hypothetical protein